MGDPVIRFMGHLLFSPANSRPRTRCQPRLGIPYLAGVLAAVFTLTGRWSFERLQYGQDAFDAPELQVRNGILLALVVITFFGAFRRRTTGVRRVHPPLLLPLCLVFFSYVSISALWAPEGARTLSKVIDIGSLAALTFCVAFWTWRESTPAFQKAFWITFCGIVCVFIVMTIAGQGLTDSRRTAMLGGGPNTFGRNVALAFFGSLWLIRRKLGWYWVILTILAPLMVLMSGSRGALSAFGCGLVVFLGTAQTKLWKRVTVTMTIASICGVLLVSSPLGERVGPIFEERILRLTLVEHYTSDRPSIARTAFEMGLEHPVLGGGLAAFPVLANDSYAHNIFLETFSETGSVGLLTLVPIFIVFGLFLIRHWRRIDRATACAFVAAFTAAQFSGDLFDSRWVFTLIIMSSSVLVGPRAIIQAPGGQRSGLGYLKTKSRRIAIAAVSRST